METYMKYELTERSTIEDYENSKSTEQNVKTPGIQMNYEALGNLKKSTEFRESRHFDETGEVLVKIESEKVTKSLV